MSKQGIDPQNSLPAIRGPYHYRRRVSGTSVNPFRLVERAHKVVIMTRMENSKANRSGAKRPGVAAGIACIAIARLRISPLCVKSGQEL